jgi:hypothetical protein
MNESFTEVKPYYVSFNDDRSLKYWWCSKDDVLKLNRENIVFVCKCYYPIINNAKQNMNLIFLYIKDCQNETADNYIKIIAIFQIFMEQRLLIMMILNYVII